MIQAHLGEFAALVTAVFWTITAIAFESASRRIGSLSVNLIRLFVAFIFLALFSYFTRGHLFPTDAGTHQWIWLALSGIVGFTLGDLLLFEAYVVIGSRISMLVMSLTPPITAFIGFLVMGERMTTQNLLGMVLTITGIILVVLQRKTAKLGETSKPKRNRLRLNYPIKGLLLAFGGAVGQGSGLVLSKFGMQDFNAFAATQIRVLAGIVGFSILFIFMRRWRQVFLAMKNTQAMGRLSIGAFFGPFLGVSFSLLAVRYTTTGVASTIMAIVPVLIIPPAVIFFKEKLTTREIVGSFIAVGGVALFFL